MDKLTEVQEGFFIQIIKSSRISSNFVIVLFSATIIISGFLAPAPSNRDIGMSWHWIDFANAVASASTLILLRSLLSKNNLLTLKIIILLGACSTGILISPIIIQIFTHHVPGYIYSAIPIGIISNFNSLIINSILVILIGESRRAMKQVAQNREKLKRYSQTLIPIILEEQSRINSEVKMTVFQVVNKLFSEVDELGKNIKLKTKVIESFKHDIDEIIRPLSHKIEYETNVQTLIDPPSVYTFSSILNLFKFKIDLKFVINPTFLTINLVNTVLLAYFFLFNFKVLLILGIPATFFSLLLVLSIHRLLKNQKLSLILAPFLASLISTLVAFIFTQFNKIRMVEHLDPLGITTLNRGAFLVTFIVLMAGILLGAREKFIDEARSLNSEILETLNAMRQNSWTIRKAIARNLHGAVQGSFQSSVLKLARSPQISDVLVSDLKDDLRKSLALVIPDGSKEQKKFLDSLLELENAWDGICEIHIQFSEEIVEKLDANPFSRECTLEVINEAVANSVKHGDAREVNIEAQIKNHSFLELKIGNPNKPDHSENEYSGLGYKIIKEATQNFKVEIIDSWFILTALIYLGE